VPGSQVAIILYILLTQREIGCFDFAFYYDVQWPAGRGIVGGSRKKIVAINNIDDSSGFVEFRSHVNVVVIIINYCTTQEKNVKNVHDGRGIQ